MCRDLCKGRANDEVGVVGWPRRSETWLQAAGCVFVIRRGDGEVDRVLWRRPQAGHTLDWDRPFCQTQSQFLTCRHATLHKAE